MLWIGLSAFGGGLLSALMGFLDSKELFDLRKFGQSAIASLIAGFGFALAYNLLGEPGIRDYIVATLAGAGFDGQLQLISVAKNSPIAFPCFRHHSNSL